MGLRWEQGSALRPPVPVAPKTNSKLACDEFIKFYKSLYQSVSKVSFDVKMQMEGFTKENFEMIVCSVSHICSWLGCGEGRRWQNL